MKDAGRIGIRVRGNYDIAANYEFLDVVYYGGASYIAKKDSVGALPEDDSEYWHIFARGMDLDSVVAGIKGAAEIEYRQGYVIITPQDIGALPIDGKAASAETADSLIHALTFAGAESGAYDGSADKTITIPAPTAVKGEAETEYRTGNVDITKANIGLGKVSNMTPEEIRGGLTAEEVENALGYSPSEITITVDSALDPSSENPVQNKVIANKITELSSDITAAGDSQKLYTDTKIADLIGGAPETLDTLKEVSDAIQENETVIEALNAAIGNKVDKVSGKGLSTNDFTTEEKNKLAGIPTVNNAKLTIQRNGTQVQTFTANQETDATVNIVVPTKTSELEDDAGLGSSSITVDTEMSETSTNPVQNKVITAYINKLRGSTLHGFEINQAEPDPDNMITHIEDSVTRSPAYMDYANDKFNYGRWGSEWFIRDLKPCMLSYGGEVAYELDKDDYEKKKDGTASDVKNESFAGNAMVGIPKVYWKISRISDDVARIHFCDENMDGTFNCWSHLNCNGEEIPYCYMPIYEGIVAGGKLRSLSGKKILGNLNAAQELDYANANNLNGSVIWCTNVFSDIMLIRLLSTLISKSTDSQTKFGAGNVNTYIDNTNTGLLPSGSMDRKGLFWGSQDAKTGVKVFGMEHPWGNTWNRIAGWVIVGGTQKIKMTFGMEDGSSVNGYNTSGNGYISVPDTTLSSAQTFFIRSAVFSEFGILPCAGGGSSTTYYCDHTFQYGNTNSCAAVGGASNSQAGAGIFTTSFYDPPSVASPIATASVSCKPLI